MAWRLLMAGKLAGPPPAALVPALVRRVGPLSIALVVGGSTVGAMLLNFLATFVLQMRGLKPEAAGIGGLGFGAAFIFIWSRGMAAAFPLLVAICMPLAWSRRTQLALATSRPAPSSGAAAVAVKADRTTAHPQCADPVFAATTKIVSPAPFAMGSVRSYAAPCPPQSGYTPSATPTQLHYASNTHTSDSGAGAMPHSPQLSSAASSQATPMITPMKGAATTVCVGQDTTVRGDEVIELVGWAQLPGLRNEDTICVCKTGIIECVGVFDGHRGQAAAAHVANALHDCIAASIAADAATGSATPSSASNMAKRAGMAIESAFHNCNNSLRAKMDGSGERGGSTAVVLCAMPSGVFCANVGDSRAVACVREHGLAERLSVDHTPSAPGELERVLSCGGHIEFNCLDGDLEVTRGFGDFDFVGMTATPFIYGPLQLEGYYSFVVLASDGLWDVATDQEVINFVRAYQKRHQCEAALEEHVEDDRTVVAGQREFSAFRGGVGGCSTLASCSAALNAWAAERGSKDDMSVVIVSLNSRASLASDRVVNSQAGEKNYACFDGAQDVRPHGGGPDSPNDGQRRANRGESGTAPEPEQQLSPASISSEFEVVRAERGRESTDEWLGEKVRLPVAALEVTSSAREQQWQWGEFTMDVTFLRPAEDNGSLAQFFVEMYGQCTPARPGALVCGTLRGEGYLLRGRLSQSGATLTLVRNEKPNAGFPPASPADWGANISRIVLRYVKPPSKKNSKELAPRSMGDVGGLARKKLFT